MFGCAKLPLPWKNSHGNLLHGHRNTETIKIRFSLENEVGNDAKQVMKRVMLILFFITILKEHYQTSSPRLISQNRNIPAQPILNIDTFQERVMMPNGALPAHPFLGQGLLIGTLE